MNGYTTVKAFMVIGSVGLLAGACSDSDQVLEPTTETTALLSVVPMGGATDVDRFASIMIGFDHALMWEMEEYVMLHEGDVTGPEVPGVWRMSDDRLELAFTPDAPLAPDTRYTIHVGGGMMDADGHQVDFGAHGEHMGGAWATDGMMGGGMMGGSVGDHHMGVGWRHSTNGTYGMVFSFRTGS